ncbi:MAG: DUF6531 domain-containing protein, partial [Planctomycetota bacterium]
MRHLFQSNLISALFFAAILAAGGGILMESGSNEPRRTDARWSNPEYVGGVPALTSGFKNWERCDLGGRVETLPPLFSMPKWGPAALTSASGCSTCGGTVSFNGDPKTAGLGLALAPPHDFSSDVGELPPHPHDHAYVMADTGEVVYTEVDFVIPGQGFDFVWYRTYRSAMEFEGWFGYGWASGVELYMVEVSSGDVVASLGDARVGDTYDWNGSSWDSPDGFNDELTKGTRSSGHTPSKYASQDYLIKTEKNGVVWEFDLALSGVKDVYVCTSITDTWGNTFTLEYDDTDTVRLTKVTDTLGHEATFQYHTTSGVEDLITKVTVSNTSIHSDYGDIVIDYDYDYTTGELERVDKQKTRQVDGGTVVRPYTEYSYYGSGYKEHNLDQVFYSSTTVDSYDFDYLNSGDDRCEQVTDADGEVHEYDYENDLTDDWTKYTDPSDQRRDFVYTDLSGGDRTIKEVREYLEDETGTDLSGHYDLKITRDCDCGQITEIEYPDGSKEKWSYDSYGNVTKYTRTSASTESDLVKQWTYDTFANYSRMLTSSGWMRAESNPSAKVTYAWDSDGGLDTVTWPTVTTGVTSSQTIVYDFEIGSDGVLDWIEDPEDNRTDYSYASDVLTITRGSGTSETEVSKVKRDEMGNVIEEEGAFGSSSKWTYDVTPDGRVLTATGPDSQEMEWEYDLRGRRTKTKQLLSGTTWTTTIHTVSTGGVETQTKADDGGINAISTFSIEEAAADRYTESLDPDDYGSRQQWGYGSYGLPWKSFNVDDSGVSKVTTRTLTLERDTMGRVTTRVLMGGTEIDYVYDGFGRLTETHEDLPSSKTRKTILTLEDWGAVEKVEVKEGTTVHATTLNYYDEALRQYKTVREDPDSVLSDLVVELERDKNGRVVDRTNVRGGTETTEYRADGRLKKTVDAGGNEVIYAYSDTARTVTRTSKEKDTSDSTFTEYDVVTTYTLAGWVDKVKDEGSASGNRTTDYTYDKAGRLITVETPLGAETAYEYDNLGRMTKDTVDIDDAGNEHAETTYTYSAGGQRTQVTDSNGTITTWTYDSFGRELTVVYTVVDNTTTSTTTRTYDSYGRLDTVTDEMGVEKDYTYDVAGRMTKVDIDKASSGLGGPDRMVFVHDDMGRVTSGKTQEKDGANYNDLITVTRGYDGFGRMDTETQHGSRTISYAHDEGGAVKEITFPSGGPIVGVKYTIDDLGRVTSADRKLSTDVEGISTSAWEETATFEYEGYREIERVQTKYDLKRTQAWSTFRRPTALRYEEDSTDTLLTGMTNTWNDDGYITVRERVHDHDGTYAWGEVYRYDEMGRLLGMWTNVRNPGSYSSTDPTANYDDKVDWNLGEVYERTSVVTTPEGGSAVTVSYTSNDGYQYTSVGGTSQTYNDNGQVTADGSDTYSWTALGQLEEADPASASKRTYSYDAFGRRVKTVVTSGATTEFIYHGWHMIGEYHVGDSEWLWQEVPMNHGEGMLEHIARDDNDLDSDTDTDE